MRERRRVPPSSSAFAILLAGPIRASSALREAANGRRILAADGGITHAEPLRVTPELWVGDFDSAHPADLERYANVPRQAFPAEKDATDGALAIKAAFERGANDILFVGAFGGRLDHSFAVLTQASALAEQGVRVQLMDGEQSAIPLGPQPQTFDLPNGTRFSVLPIGELSGLTLEGAKWPLDAVEVPFGSTLTLSNETDGPLTAYVTHGRALLWADVPRLMAT
ncbi:MAG: thiamine diphosphokinase [Devosiaceae bacterium]|nr:thiamine diphosphokinase [Devosiaceae bacterium MH13]